MVVLGAVALSASPASAFAQAKKPLPLVGIFTLGTGTTAMQGAIAFKEELASRGLKAGIQVAFEEIHVGSRFDRLPELAEALAGKSPAVIVATTSAAVSAVAKAAPHIPVVMVIVADPVAAGFAKSLARPGGMLTGISNASAETVAKFVELLITASPILKRIGFLVDANLTPAALTPMKDMVRRSAAQYAIEVNLAEVKRREEIEPAMATLAKHGMQALAIMPSPLPTSARKEILQFAAGQRWPVIAITRQWAEDGALMSYGADNNSQYRRAAYYVDRILKGARPADLPIELPATYEMAVNLKTAKALGLTLPPEIIVRANIVIE